MFCFVATQTSSVKMAHLQITPQILKAGGAEDKGDSARLQYFVGAIAVGDMVKSTLGPKGRDKLLQPMGGEGSSRAATTITNDGATILKSVWLDNPAAKILVDVSRRQDTKCGDGTTGVVVLAAELLRQAEQLVEAKVHPQVIIAGYRMALHSAQQRLEEMYKSINVTKEGLKDLLMKVAKTTLSSKLVTHEKEHFAALAVNAVMSLAERSQGQSALNLDLIQITKCPGGTVKDSFLADGFILQKKLPTGAPKKVTGCKIMVANTPMDTDKIKVYGARVRVDSFEAVAKLEAAEKEKMKRKVEAISKHGCNVFINRQLIYNYPEELFRNLNILCIEHADFDGIEKLAAVLGAEIASTFDDAEGYSIRLGSCESIEEYQIGEEKYIKFNGTREQGACSIVLRGANLHILDEAERSLHDALAVLSILVKDPRFVLGAGASELAMAEAVDELARSVVGKKALAIEAFAKGLRSLPSTILDNGGLDSAAIVTKLRALHHKGQFRMGIDIAKGDVADVFDLGILESYTSKLSQISSAAEAAEMITRVDDVIRCAPRKREGM